MARHKVAVVMAATLAFGLAHAGIDASNAQSGTDSLFTYCDQFDDNAKRLQCFNEVMALVKRLREGAPLPANALPSRTRPSASVEQKPASEFGFSRSQVIRGGESIPDNRVASNVPPPSGSSSSPTAPGSDFGLPLKVIEGENDRIAVHIVESLTDVVGTYYFRTADGQVWKATASSSSTRMRVPDGEFDAEIRKGKFGGFQLRIADSKGFIRVKRLK